MHTTAAANTEATAPRFVDFIEQSAVDALPTMLILLTVLGSIIVVYGLARGLFADDKRGWNLVIGGAVGIVAGLTLLSIRELEDDVDEESPHSATPTPDRESAPTDLTWLWITLGCIAALILLVVLISVITWAVKRAHRNHHAAREGAAAERAARSRLAAKWLEIRNLHDELLRKILHAETDWDSLFTMPALTDPSVPATYKMLRAMRDANTLRDTSGDLPRAIARGLPIDTDLTALPYPRAVEEFALAWEAAEYHARRVGQEGIPAAERKLIREIRTLLNLAENSAASTTERNLAYRRAQGLIEQLDSIHIPTQALEQLEARQMPMLTRKREVGV